MISIKKSKRDLILDSAFELILKNGYRDTKIIDIANAAGIGKGTVYEYFTSKDDLINELFKQKIADSYQELNQILEQDMPSEDKIKVYLEFEKSMSKKFCTNKSLLLDLFIQIDAFHNTELVESVHKLIGYKLSILQEIISDGIKDGSFRETDPLLAAIALMGMANFFITFNLNNPDFVSIMPTKRNTHWDADQLLHLLFNGLKS